MAIWTLVRTTVCDAWAVTMTSCKSYPLPVVLGVGAGTLGLAAWIFSRKRNLPPGPSQLRLIVATIRERGDLNKITAWMREKYGDMVSVYLGGQLVVILNSHQKIREVFVKRNLDFASRSRFAFCDILGLDDELFFKQSEPLVQREYRKFFTRSLHNHALNMTSAEHTLEAEIQKAEEYLTQHSGEDIDPNQLFQRTLAGIFSSIVFGTTYEHGDPELDEIVKRAIHINNIVVQQDGTMIEMLPPWLSRWIYSREIAGMRETFKWFRDWTQQEIDKHRSSLDPSNPRDLTDAYLLNRPADAISQNMIVDTFLTIFPDAVESISDAIRFVLLYIIHHPDVQERLHADLERVVGRSNRPSLKHRKELPYLQAVILEALRCADLTPCSLPHVPFRDTMLDGFHIPKDAMIFGNFHEIHNDPKVFPNPGRFDPARFLDADDKLTNTELFIPFSIGTRSCVGEPLVKSATFLMIATILHRFRFSFPSTVNPPSPKKSELTKFFACPESYKVVAQPKSH